MHPEELRFESGELLTFLRVLADMQAISQAVGDETVEVEGGMTLSQPYRT
jgi:hypothetical protein